MLVHNEDVFVEQALRNAARFCDRIHVADHMSTDATWEIVEALAGELDHVEPCACGRPATRTPSSRAMRARTPGCSASTATRSTIPPGSRASARAARRRAPGALQPEGQRPQRDGARSRGRPASGYLAPPSRSVTKLFNFAAIDSWTRCYRQYMHDGEIAFRPGYSRESLGLLGERQPWEESSFRCLHVCFLTRSSLDTPELAGSWQAEPDRPRWEDADAHDGASRPGAARAGRLRLEGGEVPPGRARDEGRRTLLPDDEHRRRRRDVRVAGCARRSALRPFRADATGFRSRRRRRRLRAWRRRQSSSVGMRRSENGCGT